MLTHSGNSRNVLFSINQEYLDAFVKGKKCVELRRRAPKLMPGTDVWLYSKLPTGKISAKLVLDRVELKEKSQIWDQFSHCLALTKDRFDQYLIDLDQAAILKFATIQLLEYPVELRDIQSDFPSFRPPQFYHDISGSDVLKRLESFSLRPPIPVCAH